MKLSFEDYISIKIHRTDLKLTNYIKSRLEPYNLAPEQNLIMMLLWEEDGLNQRQISRKLNKDKTNIARMASNLENKGFITRNYSSEDRRSLELYLTPTGSELREEILPVTEEFNKIATKNLTSREKEQLEDLLSKIDQNFNEIPE
ncbi:MarR family transcriptional regulator [Halobacillus halophilus]|uniref:MarR family transcription regulator n=1 Tax=Halobacillus halophilus (strain ATCC 35676 / DSM 2266 / JCM 20832 / KCTC 3685 / LMG 17431 / NBRC 102448 / NCIMB 2269) TaxID=866895 RepID=I0JMC4_HALH3|nr:MarR family transcriptional regulator [Halobacillus halophilus]ASF39380.1 MarR family transcriptional regulator [Halobacillus halophilus]CCG45294.1 MarR family transcription regulator [Halobacillus halophilus DSM 2266]